MTTANIEKPRGTLAAAWQLVRPYWLRRSNWLAWICLAAMIGSSTLTTLMQLLSMVWTKNMVDAFTTYDLPRLLWLCGVFVGLGCLFAATSVVDFLFSAWVTIRWRTWFTQRLLGFWLGNKTYYRIEREGLIDNPDQRIAEDTGLFIQYTMNLTVGLYGTLFKLATFSTVLWTKAGSLSFTFHGQLWTIPGYMLWCALLFSVAQLWFVHLVGRPLARVNYIKQRVEGDFRFGMANIRSNPEQIAMCDGGSAELRRMEEAFEHVRHNMWQILFVQLRFNAVRQFLENVSGPLPILLAAPGYFSRAMTFGDVSQVGASFGSVVSQFNWFVTTYQDFQMYRVVVARLHGLQMVAETSDTAGAIIYRRGVQPTVTVSRLALRTPQDRPLGGPASFEVKPGERWMVRGKSGVGKSTLMRALAGIWPHGDGTIDVPDAARVQFLPQRTYLPTGSLKAALCYPADPATVDDGTCGQALADAQLPALADRLEEVDRWSERLSQGEQQRLAIAGALLKRPDFLFLDEATSALDVETERTVYATLLDRLPDAGIVHVSHHEALERLHDHLLELSALDIKFSPMLART